MGSTLITAFARGRRPLGAAATLLAGSSIVLFLVLTGLLATGHRVMIEMSDSMLPALAAGDVVVTERIVASEAKRGDVITFADPTREGRTVTHRVVAKRPRAERILFTTKGDANGNGEKWTVAADGTAGRVIAVVPDVGYVLNWFRQPPVRFLFMTLASLMMGGLVLTRVWGVGRGRTA